MPWEIDPNTQCGIQQLASNTQATKEIRRLGWDMRRLVQWASKQYTCLVSLIRHLFHFSSPAIPRPELPAPPPFCSSIGLLWWKFSFTQDIQQVMCDTHPQTGNDYMISVSNTQVKQNQISHGIGIPTTMKMKMRVKKLTYHILMDERKFQLN
ncbi:uncharacterized protein VP01_4513g2 [Puccinia sorghi]|uniref:Uncharacterized protein n=1 Tax=Puccinia sorghi TaxID=27349 RepID=A0A0L6UP18_9BASI|nr:uncharacterized protein VP01_4513g2 [Puccinia sorghi]